MTTLPPPSPPASLAPAGAFGRLARLTLKELREILRDRRTIFTLVLMPLLVYPLLSIAFRQFALAGSVGQEQESTYRLGFASDAEGKWFTSYLGLDRKASPAIEFFIVPQIDEKVRQGDIDVAVVFDKPPGDGADSRSQRNLALDCKFVAMQGSIHGQRLLTILQERLSEANERFLTATLQRLDSPQRAVPVKATKEELASTESGPAVSLVTLLPLVLILMTITGAVYPAIDLTAGERERGTLEILVSAPVPRLGLLLAKYVTVLTVALLTALVNLVSMTVTVVFGGLASQLFGESALTPLFALQVLALLVLFASFFSAVLLSLTSFARSFKEAQAYLIPLMLLSLAPGLVAMTPGLKLEGLKAVTPLLNIVLLGRDMLQQEAHAQAAAVVVVSTLLYAAAAIALAARVFGSEDVLYGAQTSTADWFRRPLEARSEPSVSGALTCLALLFPAFYIAQGAISQWVGAGREPRDLTGLLAANAAATALLFGGFPALAAWFGRDRFTTAFQMRGFSLWALLGAVLLGLSLWTLDHEAIVALDQLGLVSLSSEKLDLARKMIERLRLVPVAWVVLTLGIVPGVFEELFFRGYLLRSLLAQTTPRRGVVFSALLFGAFHLVTPVGLALERFVPSTLMGLALGWVCSRTGSVWPGIVLHALHNSFLLILVYYQRELTERGFDIEDRQHLPFSWLAAAALAAACGAGLVYLGRRTRIYQTAQAE